MWSTSICWRYGGVLLWGHVFTQGIMFFDNFICLCSLRYAFQPHSKLCVPSEGSGSDSPGVTSPPPPPSILVPSAPPPPPGPRARDNCSFLPNLQYATVQLTKSLMFVFFLRYTTFEFKQFSECLYTIFVF